MDSFCENTYSARKPRICQAVFPGQAIKNTQQETLDMAPELILLEDVEDLGNAGDKVNVAAGYARNYLLPKNLAQKVSPGALRLIEARKERIEAMRK